MINNQTRKIKRIRRHKRVRKSIFGTAARPRLCVTKGIRNIYAQIINDEKQKTLVACSTFSAELRDKVAKGGNTEAAGLVGELIAQKAKIAGIKKVIFDRSGYLYHGRVKALAEGARKAGLEF